MIELEKDCPKCNGSKVATTPDFDGGSRLVYCPDCSGTGKVPSSEGEVLIDFILRYIQARHNYLTRRGQ